MAAVSTAPGIPRSSHLSPYTDDDGSMSTIPDPRSRAMSPSNDNIPQNSVHHPDLSNEVATLSNKLINAINHQTNLDDTLSATRHELEASRERVKQLEQENSEHADLLARGVYIKKSTADAEKIKLQASLADERKQRGEIEKDKKNIEQELETLTTALFEEANKMVITVREEAQKEHDIVSRRNDQLKAQLADMESLLKSHQEQLAELKQVMEQMTEERDDQTNPTTPSTPGLSKCDSKDEDTKDADQFSAGPEPVTPSYPTSFTHLLHPVLRTDLAAYDDFVSLLRMSKSVSASSRASSGSYATVGLGLGLGAYSGHVVANQLPKNGSTSSLSTSATVSSSPATPTTPASTASTVSSNLPNSVTPLKETKFYKRALAEDIEPALRLDTAPGLSWLARRSVLNAMCDGTLVVEPMPSSSKLYVFACSLCGEARKDAPHTRTHRFRTSENENSQRYPLCRYCLGRVRSSCDFLGFLRLLKDGYWRTDGEEAEKAAWDESVRLREQMFWCRMGGGVVPASQHHGHRDPSKSPRMSEDERKEQETNLSEEFERTEELRPKDVTPVVEAPSIETNASGSESALKEPTKLSLGGDAADSLGQAAQEDAAVPSAVQNSSEKVRVADGCSSEAVDDESFPEKHDAMRDSTLSACSLKGTSPSEGEKEGVKRLSITIPSALT